MRAAAIWAMFVPRRDWIRVRSSAIFDVARWRWMASTAAHRTSLGTLCGDVSAAHHGVGPVVARGQPGPRTQPGGTGEPMHVTDLGDEHRAQEGAHTGQLLDPLVAGVPDELVGDHDAEPGFVGIQGVDELPQRDHPLHVAGPQRHVSQPLASADPEGR